MIHRSIARSIIGFAVLSVLLGAWAATLQTVAAQDFNFAQPIAYGEVRESTIVTAGQSENWVFDGTAGDIITITMSALSGGIDPYIFLLDAGWQPILIAQDDDSGGGRNASIVRFILPNTGRYFIEAATFNRATAGTYSLALYYTRSSYQQPTNFNGIWSGILTQTRNGTYYEYQYTLNLQQTLPSAYVAGTAEIRQGTSFATMMVAGVVLSGGALRFEETEIVARSSDSTNWCMKLVRLVLSGSSLNGDFVAGGCAPGDVYLNRGAYSVTVSPEAPVAAQSIAQRLGPLDMGAWCSANGTPGATGARHPTAYEALTPSLSRTDWICSLNDALYMIPILGTPLRVNINQACVSQYGTAAFGQAASANNVDCYR